MSSIRFFISAALLGCAIFLTYPVTSHAQGLRVLEGATSTTLRVPMNRAVVVESDDIFAELSIANPEIADIATLSERTIYVLGRSPGRTTMTLLGADGSLIANVEVQVIPDVAEFKEHLEDILPNENIEVRTANDGIVMSGVVSSIQAMDRALTLAARYAPERISNLMVVGGTQQVMLHVRFAEMTRSVRQDLAASFGVNGSLFSGDAGVTAGSGGSNTAGTFGTGTSAVPANLAGRAGAIGFSFGSDTLQFSLTLEALEQNGVVRTLAEPNLAALSGQSASFLAGGEFPIPVETDSGTVVQFKPFGIQLDFTPTVVANEVINLQLSAEISSIDNTLALTDGTPGLSTRSTSTTVEMRDGESFVIAGLLQDDFRDSIGQVPWLGDIPVLGALFRSANYQRNQTELVIIVTAHLVAPTRGEALILPTDRIQIPTESELFLFGRTIGGANPRGSAAADVAQQDFSGSYGYVLE
jgi:pilus assembly protein CpaC